MSGGPVGNKVFAPIIFFIAFREALEAALVIGILLGMLESLVKEVKPSQSSHSSETTITPERERRILIRKLRKLVFFGAFAGLFISCCIGAGFLAVFYTQANDLWGKSEELWEGIFNLIAVCLITPMALAILRADRSRAKWSKKLDAAFRSHQQEGKGTLSALGETGVSTPTSEDGKAASSSDEIQAVPVVGAAQEGVVAKKSSSRWSQIKSRVNPNRLLSSQKGAMAIFLIPFVTTLREGLEGVVFIGGVSLGLPASSIPLPAIVGFACGLACGYLVFRGGSFSQIKFFLIASTGFLLLIAAGMASRAVYSLEFHQYVLLVGGGAAESGSGPGSYYWKTYVWHFNCCNPEDKTGTAGGWSLLNSIVGWNNTATVGSILMYVFYWLAIATYLVYACWQEGRLRLSLPSFATRSSRKIIWESGRAKTRRVAIEERRANRQHASVSRVEA
ncbi:hypothetical protein A4X09_0g2214 [Tilletia walkeri]|uniref:Iron permease FTR1 n=1 Tax=Tilletia walkeri TaxID=117179 RepID=A0A8X7NCV1_9BASI|nr:hypothetical protein A4X09_0g2214 [Tilletia walkeri]